MSRELTLLTDAHVIHIPSLGQAYVDPRTRQTNRFWVYYGKPSLRRRSSFEWSNFDCVMLVEFTEQGEWRE